MTTPEDKARLSAQFDEEKYRDGYIYQLAEDMTVKGLTIDQMKNMLEFKQDLRTLVDNEIVAGSGYTDLYSLITQGKELSDTDVGFRLFKDEIALIFCGVQPAGLRRRFTTPQPFV